MAITMTASWQPRNGPLYPTAAAAASALRPGHHVRVPAPVPHPPPLPAPVLAFIQPRAQLPAQADVASVSIPGHGGSYLVPYIQTQPDLHFRLEAQNLPPGATVRVTLDAEGSNPRMMDVGAPAYEGAFDNVSKGDHSLTAVARNDPFVHFADELTADDRAASVRLTHVARGDIVAALGDSTTEGNGGPVFKFIPNWVSALTSAADWTSPDGRNFPQAGGVSHPWAPASFTSTLGTMLAQQRGYPVLVLNDGWSGATADAYSHIISSNTLADEYAAVRPNSWVVNLGVNDPLTHQTPDQFDASLHAIVRDLNDRFGARNADIHVACPTYSRDARHDGEATYLPVIDRFRATAGLGAAPNFFAYYHDVPAALSDEVHPNAGGYRDMASMWARALAGQGTNCT
ncbi:MAG: SGNH/GDSL hydrolase family protein [Candidatus Dormibacteria bacterium]